MWIKHCYNNMLVSCFEDWNDTWVFILLSCILKNILKEILSSFFLFYLYMSYRSNWQIFNSVHFNLFPLFVYIKAFFNKQFAVIILPKHYVEVLSSWKKVFWVSHFTPDCGVNETVPPASYLIFLQYELNGLQLLTCVLFIPIEWFTFQYNFMHYVQVFQELYWVLILRVSCPTLRYSWHGDSYYKVLQLIGNFLLPDKMWFLDM